MNELAEEVNVVDSVFIGVGGPATVGPAAVQAVGKDGNEAVPIGGLVKMGELDGAAAGSEAAVQDQERHGLAGCVRSGNVELVGAGPSIDGE